MDPQKITELANLLRKNGDKILSSEFTLTLSGSLLRALNDSFTLIADSDLGAGASKGFQVVKPINAKSSVFPDLQLLHDFVQKTTLLKLNYFPSEIYFEGLIDIAKFRALRRLEVHKISISQVVGIQPLRSQLQQLICIKSLTSVDDIITHCGGDRSNGFVWNELQTADFSYNNLKSIDTALEFAQHLQYLNLRHNKLTSVTAIKWLPHLKTLDLSYNCLTHLPIFHMEACKRLQFLNISNNYVEDLLDIAKMENLTSLDLSDNCLLEHSQLLPLSALITLTMLNLQGNPLACNPKHRLATSQYLHKNTSTVKFVLDFEPLTKAEKSVTGKQKLRFVGSLNHRLNSSLSISINNSSTSINTLSSSVGSQRSISVRGKDSSSETDYNSLDTSQTSKKRPTKVRTVDIAEHSEETSVSVSVPPPLAEPDESTDSSHLETKKQIQSLRLKYGNEWLQTGQAEFMQSIVGLDSPQPSDQERSEARQQFNEYLGEFSNSNVESPPNAEPLNVSSTPTNSSQWTAASFDTTLTPIKTDDKSLYETCDESAETQYESLNNTTKEQSEKSAPSSSPLDKHKELLSLYGSSSHHLEEDEPVSDSEPDEETYIVYHEHKPSEPLFLTVSSNFVREKDTLSDRTKTKWSLQILESCERLKANTLRINFDTMRKDKQERIYCVENTLCQELEKKLRGILSQRDLTEMNISIYRCVMCGIQFTIDQKSKRYKTEKLSCPDCHSAFVAEVTDLPRSLDKPTVEMAVEPKLSPALIVEESPVSTPLVLQTKEETNSIVADCRLTTANNTPNPRSLMQATKSSANSLNESSSCSKITNSQCSFDSNQSVVGSSNTERDLEFRANESDVDIISNPSQSSIEVLDTNCIQSASRKTSEERRISQLPHLETISDDLNQTETEQTTTMTTTATTNSQVVHVQLTESSSSGSVTDSICTAYEQQGKEKEKEKPKSTGGKSLILENMQLTESGGSQHNNNNIEVKESNGQLKKAEDAGLSSMFGALFQSTNLLMSSSKKLIDSEATATASSLSIQPYKFNYSDFNDIDHRLKLYFYQSKFKEAGEHFKWLAKGRIYNEQTQAIRDGLVVISTCKCYVMEAYAMPQDDVSKWLRQVVSVTVDRLMSIQLLPWKLGVALSLRDWGGLVLLLQDMLSTDSFLLYLHQNNALPEQCQMDEQPSESIRNYLNSNFSEPLKMCALLPSCQWSFDKEKRQFELCTLLTTDSHLHVSGNGKFNWLSSKQEERKPNLELSLTQPMSNLVDVERLTDLEYTINFIDDTQNKCELWLLKFETRAQAECCLNTIGQSWEKLFGVPFSYAGT